MQEPVRPWTARNRPRFVATTWRGGDFSAGVGTNSHGGLVEAERIRKKIKKAKRAETNRARQAWRLDGPGGTRDARDARRPARSEVEQHALIPEIGVSVHHAAPRANRVDPCGMSTPRPRSKHR